jgi:excisionase family DNA binding protein
LKTEFEPQDVQVIVDRVIEALKPCLLGGTKEEDAVFDKEALAQYLRVDVSWINKQITLRSIPYLKIGKYTRFKRSHIDKWLETTKIDSSSYVKMFQTRGQVQ